MPIITNYQWRPFKYRHEVPTQVLKEQFDYQEESVCDGYFQYKGYWYHVDQFMRLGYPHGSANHPFPTPWQAYRSDSFFSGVLIAVSNCGEQYRVATYIS